MREQFNDLGVVIARNVLPLSRIDALGLAWATLRERPPDRWNPVNYEIDEHMPLALADLYRDERVLNVVESVLGPNICLYNRRFVVKQPGCPAVPLHQDSCYHVGHFKKLSAFVALTDVVPDNGALTFYLRSHKMGFLGDAGVIKREHTAQFEAFTPILHAGDVVLMHSSTWHESGQNITNSQRVIADIHYQPSDDPSGRELVRGQWMTDLRMPDALRTDAFERSRVSRLKELQAFHDFQVAARPAAATPTLPNSGSVR